MVSFGVTVGVVVIIVAVAGLRPLIVKVFRGGKRPRCGTLKSISDPANAKFEIVAVHGLGAHPEHTWSHFNPWDPPTVVDSAGPDSKASANGAKFKKVKTNLLQHLLFTSFPDAKIWSFEHNAAWITDAPVKTTEQIGKALLQELKKNRTSRNTPIVFIGHSLGGIVIKHALCQPDATEIMDDTSGIIFLGTPHHGSASSIFGAMVASATWFLGSDRTLLLSLREHDPSLSDLVDRFDVCVRQRGPNTPLRIHSFAENKSTYIFKWLCIGQTVRRDSADVHSDADKRVGIDTDHSGLNKCGGLDDEYYKKLTEAIVALKVPSILEQVDTALKTEHYTDVRLKVERLSGAPLSLDQCYINLAIVEQTGKAADRKQQASTQASLHSLFIRKRVETPGQASHVELATLFDPRIADDGSHLCPRRILIRGQAGIGKTTLCKKMVHDFIRDTPDVARSLHRSWTLIFDRVLWIPLRHLKSLPSIPRNLQKLFFLEFFSQDENKGPVLARHLAEAVCTNTQNTLFILDGLDEVIHDLDQDGNLPPLLLTLLESRNVIITSRPGAVLPHDLEVDLELETVGFYPEQVKAYLEKDVDVRQHAEKIQALLQKHWLLQGLVRIPIQLDALCYTWKSTDDDNGDTPDAAPDTMTEIYKSIELKLWRKDIFNLNRKGTGAPKSDRESEVRRKVQPESEFLELLAFNGLYNNTVDFTSEHRDAIDKAYTGPPPQDQDLARLSFLRTSDPTSQRQLQTYHFIHLTFQEYFAAKCFVRQWTARNANLVLVPFKRNQKAPFPVDAVEFLHQHKYLTQFMIFWRFVAGLLEGPDHVKSFFDELAAEPRDLLGPVHQRLVMHCLGEVSSQSLSFQTDIENRLSDWMLLEYKVTERFKLVKAKEATENSIINVLKALSGEPLLSLLGALETRPAAEESIRVLVQGWLWEDVPQDVKAAVHRLQRAQGTWKESVNLELPQTPPEDQGPQNVQSRSRAKRAIRKQPELIRETTSDLILRLGRGLDARMAAIVALRDRWDLNQENLNAIVELLEDEDTSIRTEVVTTLQNLPLFLRRHIVHPIEERIEHHEPYIRESALKALRNLPNLTQRTINIIAAQLNHENNGVSRAAAQALQNRPNLVSATIKALREELQNPNRNINKLPPTISPALKALENQFNINLETIKVIAELTRYQSTYKPYVRVAAHRTLQTQSPSAQTVDDITKALTEESDHLPWAAVQVLQNQPDLSPDVIKAIEKGLTVKANPDRCAAVQALQNQRRLPARTIKALEERLTDRSFAVRQAVMNALRNHPLSAEATSNIVKDTTSKFPDNRQAAIQTLHKQPNLSLETITAIAARLDDEHANIREAAVKALHQRDLSPDIVNLIARRLADEDWRVRQGAVDALYHRSDLTAETIEWCISAVYRGLLKASFDEHVYWYIEEGAMYMVFDSRKIRLVGSEDRFRDLISRAKDDFKIAVPDI